jgi:hypothetical protein
MLCTDFPCPLKAGADSSRYLPCMSTKAVNVHTGDPAGGAVTAPAGCVLVLGHMRGTTSLLAHLLGSHPQICGYFETHIRYREPDDLSKLRQRLEAEVGPVRPSQYLMDKVVHDYVCPEFIERMHMRTIFLVREPEQSLRSLWHMMRDEHGELAWHKAIEHYTSRLRWLADCAATLSRPGPFVRSTSLIHSTAAVLRALERYLQLSTPLREAYRTFARSGQWSYGDFSSMILAGRVMRDGRTSHGAHVDVPAALLDEATSIHISCVSRLEDRCLPVRDAA